MSPAEAAGTPYGAATPVMRAQVRCRRRRAHGCYGSRSSTTAIAAYDSAVFIDNLAAHDAAGHVHRGPDPARPGRRDHGAYGRRHRQHSDADAHRYGRQRGGRCPDRDGPHLQRRAAGRCAGTDAGGAADRHHVVRAGRRARGGPVHGAGDAGQRSGRRRQRAHNVCRSARRGGDSRGRRRLEQPADPRRPRQRRHPGRPGHLRRLAAAGPRQDLRRARGLRRRLHQVPAGHGAAGGGEAAQGVRGAEGRGQHPDGRAARHAQGPRGRDVAPTTRAGARRRPRTSTTASSRSSSRRPRRSRRSRRC